MQKALDAATSFILAGFSGLLFPRYLLLCGPVSHSKLQEGTLHLEREMLMSGKVPCSYGKSLCCLAQTAPGRAHVTAPWHLQSNQPQASQ